MGVPTAVENISDTANYDDRDRLRYEFEVQHSHDFNPSFYLASRAQVILEHLVYIFGQKSDQNNWNRIFKISPEVFFSPAVGWGNLARFELAANYSDYDFDLDPANIKSTVYRRYTASDSLGWNWSRGWDLILDYSLDLEDGGRLLWSDWVEQIAEKYRTQKASAKINRQTPCGIQFQTGFTVYQRKKILDLCSGTGRSPLGSHRQLGRKARWWEWTSLKVWWSGQRSGMGH